MAFVWQGPLDLNNEKLMTQSFSSCTHLRIFGTYYPWRFKNWFSDNWAAQVYAERTFWLTDIEVDHSVTSGPRYVINYEHGVIVPPLVRAGRKRLCEWLRRRRRDGGDGDGGDGGGDGGSLSDGSTAPNGSVAEAFSPCLRADYGVPFPPPPPSPSPSPPPSPPPPPPVEEVEAAVDEEGDEEGEDDEGEDEGDEKEGGREATAAAAAEEMPQQPQPQPQQQQPPEAADASAKGAVDAAPSRGRPGTATVAAVAAPPAAHAATQTQTQTPSSSRLAGLLAAFRVTRLAREARLKRLHSKLDSIRTGGGYAMA